jgi:N-acetylglucosamine malate deacetylase 1
LLQDLCFSNLALPERTEEGMRAPTRRSFLKEVSAGVTAFSLGAGASQAAIMPGRPPQGPTVAAEQKPASVMAIAAHPGDAFFAMGAPVALAAHAGAKGCLLSLSLGERGSSTIAPAQYGMMQREAAIKGAGMLGASAEFLHYPDGEIPVNEEAKFAVCDFIRQYKPQVIVTHWKGSWHKDHRACYEIVQDAVFYAALPAITRKLPAHSVSQLYFDDNWEDAEGFVPDTYLDIMPVFEKWIHACAMFPMWRGENGFHYDDYYASLATVRGCVSNFSKAVALMSSPDQRVRHLRAL